MSHINKSALTKIEIIQVATKMFLENGYSATTAKSICSELGMSTGNLTFHYPTKEHLLAVLVDLLCDFQWDAVKKETDEGHTAIMALCLELMAMAAMCEDDHIAKDFFLSAYTNPMSLDIIRKNDRDRAKVVFAEYCKDWTEEQFAEAEVLTSGIEYATLMTTESSAPLEYRIRGAMRAILTIYNVPADVMKAKIQKVLALNYREIGHRTFENFKKYVADSNENAFLKLLKR